VYVMTRICQILLIGSDIKKFERGIVELGANKIIVLTPNQDKYYALTRKIIKKFDGAAETLTVPIFDTDTFTFAQEFKRLLAENFMDYEIRINASTDVRNWKILAYFSVNQFLPHLQELSDNRIIFYEVIGGEALPLSVMKYVRGETDEDLMELDDDSDYGKNMEAETEKPQDIDASKLKADEVLEHEIDAFFDDGWGSPQKRPPMRIEIYPIDSLTSTEQHIVDIIARQEASMDLIQSEYALITGKEVTAGLLSRYLGKLKKKAIIVEGARDGRHKVFKLTDYGLKYVLPIIREEEIK